MVKLNDLDKTNSNDIYWENIVRQYRDYNIDEISESTYEYLQFLNEFVTSIKKLSVNSENIICLVYGSVARGTADTKASFFEKRVYLESKHYGSVFERMPSSDVDIAIIGEDLGDLYDQLSAEVHKIASIRYPSKLISVLFAPTSLVRENIMSNDVPNVYKRLVQESEKLVLLGAEMLNSLTDGAYRSEVDRAYSIERVAIKHYINENIGESKSLFIAHEALSKNFPTWSAKNLSKEFSGEITSPFGTTVKRIKFPNRFPYTTRCSNFDDINELNRYVNES